MDGTKIRVLSPGSISPYRQKKLKVSSREIANHILTSEPDLFLDAQDIVASLDIHRKKGVIDLEISSQGRKIEMYAYLITDYY